MAAYKLHPDVSESRTDNISNSQMAVCDLVSELFFMKRKFLSIWGATEGQYSPTFFTVCSAPWLHALGRQKEIADLGVNVVRLGAMWTGVEPEEGNINATYLAIIEVRKTLLPTKKRWFAQQRFTLDTSMTNFIVF